MDEFPVHEVADEDPYHSDGQVELGGEFGDGLRGLTAQPDDLHVFRGQRRVGRLAAREQPEPQGREDF